MFISEIEYNFLHKEKYCFHLVPFEKIHEVENFPGLYIWKIRAKNESDRSIINLLYEMNNLSKLSASLKGNLGLTYEGELKRKTKKYKNLKNFDLFRCALPMVASQLYIGISRNLGNRLSTHKNILNKNMSSLNKTLKNCNNSDSDDESNSFGQRLAGFFLNQEFSSLDCLFVEYIYHPQFKELETTKNKVKLKEKMFSELKEVESILNYSLNPIFGRR